MLAWNLHILQTADPPTECCRLLPKVICQRGRQLGAAFWQNVAEPGSRAQAARTRGLNPPRQSRAGGLKPRKGP